MRIFSINGYTHNQQKTFKGETKYLDVINSMYNSTLSIKDNKHRYEEYDKNNHFKNHDYSEELKNRPYATVERTLGSYHSIPTREIYYADPKEDIPVSLKDKVDYIIYDNEPPYPKAEGEISETYFGKKFHNYEKDFDEIREYYYRWEMAEAKKLEHYRKNILADVDLDYSKQKYDEIKNNINIAKYQQWQAQVCKDIYNESQELRNLKDSSESCARMIDCKISELRSNVDSHKENIKTLKTELHTREKESILADLNLKEYKKIEARNAILDSMENTLPINKESRQHFEELLEEAKALVEKLDGIKLELRESIAKSKLFIAQAPQKFKAMSAEKAAKEILAQETKAKLIPLFDKLKNFYNVQQIIRR